MKELLKKNPISLANTKVIWNWEKVEDSASENYIFYISRNSGHGLFLANVFLVEPAKLHEEYGGFYASKWVVKLSEITEVKYRSKEGSVVMEHGYYKETFLIDQSIYPTEADAANEAKEVATEYIQEELIKAIHRNAHKWWK